MSSLQHKNILLGITGGIAAYKSAELTRRLKDEGADVRVVMTQAATEFVTPLTFQALSGNPVHTSLLDPEAEAAMGHIELARWADAVLIAPASANFMGKLAQGRADDLLSTLCLATEAPLALAPAMNRAMWSNAATQENAALLVARDIVLFGPASGSQACGEIGDGRMLEPADLVAALRNLFKQGELAGLNLMITAGPTREPLDPVRYITNRSSGRMGFALAQAASEAGARVTLISGPVMLETPEGVRRINVDSAQEMYDAVMTRITRQHIFIGCAAVADYRPVTMSPQKIKKSAAQITLEMVRNPDILAEVAALGTLPFTLGFAAETQDLLDHARCKLEGKKLDMIAANNVASGRGGFDSKQNALEVMWRGGQTSLPMTSKHKLARQLIAILAAHYSEQHPHSNIIEINNAKNRSQDPG